MNRGSDAKDATGLAFSDSRGGVTSDKGTSTEDQHQSDRVLQSNDNATGIDELSRDTLEQGQQQGQQQHQRNPAHDEVRNTAQDESLLLSPEELTPIELGDFLLPINQYDTDFLVDIFQGSLGDQDDDFDHPDEDVDYSDIDGLFSGNLEDIEVEEVYQDDLDEFDYNHVFEDPHEADSSLLASLEQDLINLTLKQMPDLVEQDDAIGEQDDAQEAEDDLPWYMYCQPCRLEDEVHRPGFPYNLNDGSFNASQQGLHAIEEDQPLQDGELPARPSNRRSELDDLPFSFHNIDQLPDASSTLDQSFQSYVVSRRPEAVKAALSFTQSFGTGIYQPLVDKECPNETACLGHQETIYGLQFSPCGTYMASASQDATIRVWDVATHRLLQTLTGHSKESECLRVAWYVLVNRWRVGPVMTILSRAFFALTLVFSFFPSL